MERKRKNSGEALLEDLRSQQGFDTSSPNEVEDQVDTPPLADQASDEIEFLPEEKDDPLLVDIIDTTTEVTICRKVTAKEVWQMARNLKIKMDLNSNGHGNDNGSNLLVRFLGKIARTSTLCPIHIENWHFMPKDKKAQQWKLVEDHFLFDYAAGCKWVMSTLGDRLKSYKYQLRCKYFTRFNTIEDLLANRPPTVDSVDWSAFVRHYKGDKMKAICDQNTRNRKKLKVSHAGGSKSNARKGSQMVKTLGRGVCRGEVILSTLLKKNGSYVSDEAKSLAAKISENLAEDQECAALLGVPSQIFAEPNDAIGKALGPERHGRVRGMGVGLCPSGVFGLQASLVNSRKTNISSGNAPQNCVEELMKTKAELSQTQTKLSTLYKFLQDKFGSEVPNLDDVQQL